MPDSEQPLTTTDARRRDALALAELIYDMYKEDEQRQNTTQGGQNNAQPTETN